LGLIFWLLLSFTQSVYLWQSGACPGPVACEVQKEIVTVTETTPIKECSSELYCEGMYQNKSFSGSWQDGKPSGSGVLIAAECKNETDCFPRIFARSFKDGKLNGQGSIMEVRDGRLLRVYEGDVVQGFGHGRGVVREEGGKKFAGDIVNGMPSGYGTISEPGSFRFDGEVLNGKQRAGILIREDGNRLEGEFDAGLFRGSGSVNGIPFRGLYSDNLLLGVVNTSMGWIEGQVDLGSNTTMIGVLHTDSGVLEGVITHGNVTSFLGVWPDLLEGNFVISPLSGHGTVVKKTYFGHRKISGFFENGTLVSASQDDVAVAE
jgi:hypothetical protein